jgi:hypothetical protein
MKSKFMLAVAACVAAPTYAAPSLAANTKHNGACVGFAGSTGGVKFAGIKCYRDIDPGNYVIRYTIKERDDPAQYRQLLKVPRKPVRCTLVNKGSHHSGTMDVTTYDIQNC